MSYVSRMLRIAAVASSLVLFSGYVGFRAGVIWAQDTTSSSGQWVDVNGTYTSWWSPPTSTVFYTGKSAPVAAPIELVGLKDFLSDAPRTLPPSSIRRWMVMPGSKSAVIIEPTDRAVTLPRGASEIAPP